MPQASRATAEDLGKTQSEVRVASVAEGLVGGVLAAAKIGGFRLGGFKFDRCESGASVTAIAEWLVGAEAAGAPRITLSGFELNGVGTFLDDCRF